MLMDLLRMRRSVRRYTRQQVSREALETILQAGALAPSAGGGQRTFLLGGAAAALTEQLGVMNLAHFDRSNLAGHFVSREQPSVIDDPTLQNGFYGAPCAAVVFAQDRFLYREADAYCCAENMVLQAAELGIASCIVSRGAETFASPEGQALLRKWDVPPQYSAVCFVILGFLRGEAPKGKPRRPGRIKIIEE